MGAAQQRRVFAVSPDEAASLERALRKVMSAQEEADLECALRKARHDVFSDDPEIESVAARQITAIRAKLKPVWDARQEWIEHKRGQELLRRWA